MINSGALAGDRKPESFHYCKGVQLKQSRELSFALEICRKAGALAMDYLNAGVKSCLKDDGSPVTAADKECERIIRAAIQNEFPGDDILGEEEGASVKGGAARKWIIDPIDGTYNYARAIPIFSTLLALETNGRVALGVIHAPAVGDTFWAESGGGAFKNGARLQVSDKARLADALFNFGGPNRILQEGYWDGLTKLVSATCRQRGFGDYLGFAFVFEGKAEAMLEIGVQPWDLAPMKVIVEEAGGRFSDLSGGESIYEGSCLVSNGLLHEPILRVLSENRIGAWHK
jgi:histidinol-phosphatase